MILADENLHISFIQTLRIAGYEVISIFEGFRGISDMEVINMGRDANAVLITEDKDFGELAFAHKINCLTIVFLRYRKEDMEIMQSLLLQVFQDYYRADGQYFITIARRKIRVTKL